MNRRRGVIFIAALGVIVVLTGLALVFAQSMRTEAVASANRRSQAQADSIELGAEQWVLAQVDAYQPDAMTIEQVPAEAIQLGTGYFWIMQFNPDNDTDDGRLYGITDESGKLNINSATSVQLQSLPGDLEQNVADAITDWRNTTSKATSDGAETDYYQSLTEPYECKNASYETVEELLLVEGVTPAVLWGNGQNVVDMNRDGVLSAPERQASGFNSQFTGAQSGGIDGRGIYNYLTCYTTTPASGRTAGTTGRVNINTASDVVLVALGMSPNDAQQIVNEREGNDYTNTSWASSVTGKYPAMRNALAGQSSQYSADIVAVSGDGRAFKRVRIVVDGSSSPSKIVYRKDLTSFGWPLPDEIKKQLASGKPIQPGTSTNNANP
jgi:type II secretory pathway component PulK